jgi:hypothetical protein
MGIVKKSILISIILHCGTLYANIKVPDLSNEQLQAILGVGKYDKGEFDKDQERFYNNEAFWYGIKNLHDQRYAPAYLWFLSYEKMTNDRKMGSVFGAHVMLKLGKFDVAEALYFDSISKYGSIPNAEKGRLILFALMNDKKKEMVQLAKTLKLLNEEKDTLKRISYARVIVPTAIYLRQKDVFQKMTLELSFDQLVRHKDLALNFAKGVSLFEIKDEYKKSDEVLKSVNMELITSLSGATIFKIEPETADRKTRFRSRDEKVATIYFDLNAAGWGDEYDFPRVSQVSPKPSDPK